MPNIRVELPRDHWAELRDPWEVSEEDRRPLKRANIRRYRRALKPAGSEVVGSPVPLTPGEIEAIPEVTDEDLDREIDDVEAHENDLLAFFVVKWGGPFCEGKEPTVENMAKLPVPLRSELDRKVSPLVAELWGTAKNTEDEESPTTP